MQASLNYHNKPISNLYNVFQSSISGLNNNQVLSQRKIYGENTLPDPSVRHPLKIFLAQLKSLMVYILLGAALISYFTGHLLDVYVILSIVVINTLVGFYQEMRAERSISKLRELILPRALTRRNNVESSITASELVPGDIVIIKEGDRIPADLRIITSKNLAVDESLLTGESIASEKLETTLNENIPLSERKNMLFMGTTVVRGSATGIVVATATKAALGQVAENLNQIKQGEDHFKTKTNTLAMQMSLVAFGTTIITFLIGYFIRGFELSEIFMLSIASLVAGIPEGLPVVLTVVLALSAERMAKKNAVIRRLSATETLAIVDTIITDKTGTLTKNQMTATHLMLRLDEPHLATDMPKGQNLKLLLTSIWHCHQSATDPTELALKELGKDYKQSSIEVLDELPFSQEHRYHACLLEGEGKGVYAFVAGAAENILESSTLSNSEKETVHTNLSTMTSQALRTVAFAYKKLPNKKSLAHQDLKSDLIYLGTAGLIDPERPEVKQALFQAKQAGITTYMATGDHPETALAIAHNIGLIAKSNRNVITGSELEGFSESELKDSLVSCRVFARMTPDAKLRLANTLQALGHTVAMTGDGVNDAPALKTADIGIAMGQKGTDVAREVADIVLTDDNYASIIQAIKEGRTQRRNIRRTSFFLITTNVAESVSLIVFLLLGFPIPLLPKQILWLNLVTGGITDIALATEPIHGDVLKNPPSQKSGNILNRSVLPFLTLINTIMLGLALLAFIYFESRGIETARTAVFVILSLTQLFNLYNMRSLKKSILEVGFFTNKFVNWAVFSSIILLLVVIYHPLGQKLFDFAYISPLEIVVLTLASSLVLLAAELYKKIVKFATLNIINKN